MITQQFLDLVLPDENDGYRVIGYLKKGSEYFNHTIHETNAAAAASVANLVSRGLQTYHAMASYEQPRYVGDDGRSHLRTHKNVQALKSFWLDIDVKPGVEGHYQSREEAVQAIKAFCLATGVPRPFLVGSGRFGVHVYWVMERSMPMQEWKPHAERLKLLTMHHGVLADHAITADAARVLRPVGSINFKLGSDPVELLTQVRTYQLADFAALLQAAADKAGVVVRAAKVRPVPQDGLLSAAPAHIPQGEEKNTDVRYDGLPVELERVVQHCELLAKSYNTGGADDPEPIWYACMGIAGFVIDTPKAIEALAGKHPEFDPEKSAQRVAQWRERTTGPTTCKRLQSAHGTSCPNCPSVGKISTPIQLGRVVEEAAPPQVTEVDMGKTIKFDIPNPPHPYKRSKDKGIYYELENEAGVTTPIQICPFDIYPTRLQECERKEEFNVVWRITLPHTGGRDVTLPSRIHAAECGKLMGELAARGLPVQPKNAKVMQEFMVSYIKELQEAAPAARQFAKLGWRGDGTFVAPAGLCTRSGFVEFPSVQPFIRSFKGLWEDGHGYARRGTVDGWRQCLEFYNDPRYIAHQLYILIAASAPLLYFTNVKGMHVNAVGETGSGKTTIGYVVAGMWGHPVEYCINGTKKGATINALFRNISLRNNLPVIIDEISNWKGEDAGEFCYSISQGIGRERMNGAESFAQAETWNTIAASSSNQPIGGKIGAYKADSQAEQMRLLEFRVEDAGVHEKWEADAMLRKLQENYGMAGPEVLQFITKNQDAVRAKIYKTMEAIDRMADVESHERYWSSGIACGIVFGSVLHHLGLIKWDLDAIAKHGVKLIHGSRARAHTDNSAEHGLFNTLLDVHNRDTMILSGAPVGGNLGSTIETPLQRPHGRLLIRKEMATGMLYVATSLVRKYCQDNNLDIKVLEDELLKSGAMIDKHHRKVLGAGTIEGGGQVRCWNIDWRLLK